MSSPVNEHELPVAAPPEVTPDRRALAALIREFLASQIGAFEFDKRLAEFRDSADPIIQFVSRAVWYFYDDCTDHLVCLSKAGWDYFQRLLLALETDCRIERESKRHWNLTHAGAAAALAGFIYFARQWGWGYQLLILSIPFGCISVALAWVRSLNQPAPHPYETAINPFATFGDLATAYHSTQFRKTRYPRDIAQRWIRGPILAGIWQLIFYVMWLLFSPVVLLAQMIPFAQTQIRIVASPGASGRART